MEMIRFHFKGRDNHLQLFINFFNNTGKKKVEMNFFCNKTCSRHRRELDGSRPTEYLEINKWKSPMM